MSSESLLSEWVRPAWTRLIAAAPPEVIWTVGPCVVHFVLFWGLVGLFAVIDLFQRPTSMLKYKMQPGANQPVSREKFMKAARVALVNQFLVMLPMSILVYPIVQWRGMSHALPLPSFSLVFRDLFGCVIIEEILFYYGHRMLHSKRFYKRIHKFHHEWTAPVGVAAIYAHPIEHIISNILPALCGSIVLGSHLFTMYIWMGIATLNAVNSHSGYHLPFMPSGEYHDFHHLKFTQNYGVLGILDYLHGTDVLFRSSKQYEYHFVLTSLKSAREVLGDALPPSCSSSSISSSDSAASTSSTKLD